MGQAMTTPERSVKKLRRAHNTPGTAYVHFKADPRVRGLVNVVICVSLPIENLALIDAECKRRLMNRSHWLREAAEAHIETDATDLQVEGDITGGGG